MVTGRIHEEEKLVGGKSEYPILKLRMNDFAKKGDNSDNSLLKPHSFFAPVKGEEDVFSKKTKLAGKIKHYFAKGHPAIEYFAMEILVALGFHAPKCRITDGGLLDAQEMKDGEEAEDEAGIETVVEKIRGYIPMLFVRHDVNLEEFDSSAKAALSFRAKYKLDIPSQQLISLGDGKRYKISGNAFASDLAVILLQDTDFQPESTNLGLVRCGNRFYCVLIDKEHASFSEKSYERMLQVDDVSSDEEWIQAEALNVIANDALYKSRYPDQIQFVLFKLAQALTIKDKQCIIDKIFLNPRVLKTKMLQDLYKDDCDNFKKTAVSVLEHYQKLYGENFLDKFSEREELRAKVVEGIIRKLNLNSDAVDILMEDLRGPYYLNYFSDKKQISKADLENHALFNAIVSDVKDE